ncbi:SDR family NAD(P)-dependent oxidoreductase [Loktanella sp. S4079]|uniref:SDR family NAD(P)-dependent oxidoreductase n=1 Tax=Loktanella sp. S4079 TaxID=579483 RepID=UPI0005FA6101|nr:SDR family NAD(P)-dependent oxidoreductase [Loktanella sp. S4079]KJZ20155.1 UDP-glucuronate 5-epimerase [Loktanella sp. S4079]
MTQQTILVTGAAGFIGFHLSQLLLGEGWKVVGLDSHNDYYDPALKSAREEQLRGHADYRSVKGRVEEPGLLMELFETHKFDAVVHLAAQAGVRYSIENPRAYTEANLMGTFELLEAARAFPPKHLLLASTSSVYGANTKMPYRETDQVDHQMSYYAATKKATEAMSHSYAHLFDLPVTMFRFFTVYGPWGRPDMAPYLFTSAIMAGEPIKVFNHGDMKRDFTFVKDLVRGIRLLIDAVPVRPTDGIVPEGDSLSPVAPWRVVNVGNGESVPLMEFIGAIERASNHTAVKNMLPMQAGDVPATWADNTLLRKLTGYTPETSVSDGISQYVDWHRKYYGGA